MDLETPSKDLGSITKYVDGMREAIDACKRAELSLENCAIRTFQL